MVYNQSHFGLAAYNQTIGKVWVDAFESVLKKGETTFDEGRKRLCLQSFRIKAETQDVASDDYITSYGNQENIAAILKLTFEEPKMVDIDVNPSFGPGAKSYYTRIQEGRMLEYVTKRLSKIPESKKGIIIFPTYEDFEAVLNNPWNDYLPCIVSVQFRMVPNGGSGRYKLNTIFFARSLDIFQKGLGNLVAIAKMAEIVAKGVSEATGREVSRGFLEGFITDVHLYEENFAEAKALLKKVKAKPTQLAKA